MLFVSVLTLFNLPIILFKIFKKDKKNKALQGNIFCDINFLKGS